MRICLRPSDPETCDDLAFFLRRHECSAEVGEEGTVFVELPHAFMRSRRAWNSVSTSVSGKLSIASACAPMSSAEKFVLEGSRPWPPSDVTFPVDSGKRE